MDMLFQFIANGLVSGSFYALSALGLTLIFGLMRVVNFAHGELYMLGGVMGWLATTVLSIRSLSIEITPWCIRFRVSTWCASARVSGVMLRIVDCRQERLGDR